MQTEQIEADPDQADTVQPLQCPCCPSDEFAFCNSGHLICWSCGFGFLPGEFNMLKAGLEKVN